MNIKNELKIFLRFLKEKNIYNDYKSLFVKLINDDCDVYDVFDANIGWHYAKEGFKFWYFIQLDFIKTLLIYDPKNSQYLQYYDKLLKGYGHEYYMNESFWKSHKEFYYEIAKRI